MLLPALWLPSVVVAALASAAPAVPALATAAPSTLESAVRKSTPLLDASGARAERTLAELLVDAESIDLTASSPRQLRFALQHAGAAYRLDVALDGGRVTRATLSPARRRDLGDGQLSWLGMAIGDRERVTAATVSRDGVVTIELDDGTTVPLTAEAGDDYVGC